MNGLFFYYGFSTPYHLSFRRYILSAVRLRQRRFPTAVPPLLFFLPPQFFFYDPLFLLLP